MLSPKKEPETIVVVSTSNTTSQLTTATTSKVIQTIIPTTVINTNIVPTTNFTNTIIPSINSSISNLTSSSLSTSSIPTTIVPTAIITTIINETPPSTIIPVFTNSALTVQLSTTTLSTTTTTTTTTNSSTTIENNNSNDNSTNNKDSVLILNKQRLQELVAEIDTNEQLDEDVEDILLNIADDFIDNLVSNACLLAKHRGSKNVETKDVQLILEKNYNLYIPGFGSLPLNEEFKNIYKKSPATEAHKQRMALIKKTIKKF